MVVAKAAENRLPNVTGKPGEFFGGRPKAVTTRSHGETAQLKDHPLGIVEHVAMSPQNLNPSTLPGDSMPAGTADKHGPTLSVVGLGVEVGRWGTGTTTPLFLKEEAGGKGYFFLDSHDLCLGPIACPCPAAPSFYSVGRLISLCHDHRLAPG